MSGGGEARDGDVVSKMWSGGSAGDEDTIGESGLATEGEGGVVEGAVRLGVAGREEGASVAASAMSGTGNCGPPTAFGLTVSFFFTRSAHDLAIGLGLDGVGVGNFGAEETANGIETTAG